MAAELLRRQYRLFPNRANIPDKIEQLRAGRTDPQTAERRLSLIQQNESKKHECNRQHDH